MMGGKFGAPCCKMPIPLHVCPTCSQGVKQTRGWSWIDPKPWIAGPCSDRRTVTIEGACPLSPFGSAALGDRVGLLWIGTQFYPTPEHFAEEARAHGISRRIIAMPRGFKVGEHFVFLAHPKACKIEGKDSPGVFQVFKPTRVEKIVTETQARDVDAMAELEKKGITPFIVPDDDADHRGTVYDDASEGEEAPTLSL